MLDEQNFSICEIASAKPPPALKRRQLSARQRKQPNFALGEQGEIRAVNYLISLNYLILDRNVRFGSHEVDIIARDQNCNELVFVEVKTRASGRFGSPSQAVSRAKVESLRRVAQAYLHSRHLLIEHRFDIIAVLPTTIEHYQNITWNF